MFTVLKQYRRRYHLPAVFLIMAILIGPMENRYQPDAPGRIHAGLAAAAPLTQTGGLNAANAAAASAPAHDAAGAAPAKPTAAETAAAVAAGKPAGSGGVPVPSDPEAAQPADETDAGLFYPYMDFSKLETVEVMATGYYAGIESTGKTPNHPEYGVTYSGVKVRKDRFSTIAADPKVFPLGTILFIPGYGYGVVADTGSAIKGKKIDLYFPTKQQVYENWGKKSVKVAVLKRGDGKVTEVMMDRLNSLKF